MSNVKSNLWKILIFLISQRRNFMPILAIYFLTLPDTYAHQVGIYTSIGFLASFFFEIPSGYFSDRFGHKNTLILAKFLMVCSMVSYIFARGIVGFTLGAVLLSLSFAFSSGAKEAFVHNTLVSLKREDDYTEVMSKIAANASLVSMVLIICLPFFTKISMVLPLKINLVFDLLGMLVVLTLVEPRNKFEAGKTSLKKIFEFFKLNRTSSFYPFSIFVGLLGGFIMASGVYRYIYLEDLGLAVVLVGFVMGLSRLVWFLLGHQIHKIEKKLDIKKVMYFEIIGFTIAYLAITILNNPYLVAILFIITVGYYWSRKPLYTNIFLKKFAPSNLKATVLSIKSQIEAIFQIILSFGIGFVMSISYKTGYFVLTAIMFFGLMIIFHFFLRNSKLSSYQH